MRYLIFIILITSFSCKNSEKISSVHLSQASVEKNETMQTETNGEDLVTAEFMGLLNNHRLGIGLKEMILVHELSDIATQHSLDMANNLVSFGHNGFSDRCSDGRDVLNGARWCGENVARGQKSAKTVFMAWMNSPGHRANIEKALATHTGFGFVESASGSIYWTQIFFGVSL